MNVVINSKKHFLLAIAVGAIVTYGALGLIDDDSIQLQQISILETRIHSLEELLAQKEALINNRLFYSGGFEQQISSKQKNPITLNKPSESIHAPQATDELPINDDAPRSEQLVKDLVTQSNRDPRSFSEKINDMLVSSTDKESIAIASKGIFDMAENIEYLPDYALSSIYQDQTDPHVRRVTAQVLSLRGDNSLIEKYVTQAHDRLHSDNPETRQEILVELAKTHYVSAANAIVPLLQDNNIGVRLDALLALRATGNQSHIRQVEILVNDPDPSVSWLAKDVINNLKNLSELARTSLSHADIATELPPLVNP